MSKSSLRTRAIPLLLKLGCPKSCIGFSCVDIYPEDSGVIKQDILDFLLDCHSESTQYIELKNILEHFDNVGALLEECNRALKDNGRIEIIADNAMYPFFYLHIPRLFWGHTKYGFFGFGVHNGCYPKRGRDKHFHIFTKDHLENLLNKYRFEILRSEYGLFKWGLRGWDVCFSPFIHILAAKV